MSKHYCGEFGTLLFRLRNRVVGADIAKLAMHVGERPVTIHFMELERKVDFHKSRDSSYHKTFPLHYPHLDDLLVNLGRSLSIADGSEDMQRFCNLGQTALG